MGEGECASEIGAALAPLQKAHSDSLARESCSESCDFINNRINLLLDPFTLPNRFTGTQRKRL